MQVSRRTNEHSFIAAVRRLACAGSQGWLWEGICLLLSVVLRFVLNIDTIFLLLLWFVRSMAPRKQAFKYLLPMPFRFVFVHSNGIFYLAGNDIAVASQDVTNSSC